MNFEPAGHCADAYSVPIEHHALLSDQRALALVNPQARIVWLCAPRLDAAPQFAQLLGTSSAGYWAVSPADDAAPLGQSYADDSLVLRTRFPGFEVLDFLDVSAGRWRQRAGRSDLIRVLRGNGRVRITFAPRLDFGRVETRLQTTPTGLSVADTPDPISLHAPGVQWKITRGSDDDLGDTATAEIELDGGPLALELRYGHAGGVGNVASAEQRLQLTQQFWSSWLQGLEVPAGAREQVRLSALLLRGLCYGPTGAIAAAGTTSLPEELGGVRNWDYRFCWLRDAAIAAASLLKLGSAEEALRYLEWLLDVVEESDGAERLRPLYTVGGRMLGPEAEITQLCGYRNSRPVRVGNAAAAQVQLDVFGPVVDLVAQLAERDAALTGDHWRLVQALVSAVAKRWHEPDHGIWEIRRSRRHHVHSKVMCWLTVRRACDVAQRFAGEQRPEWEQLAQQIADDVLTNGYRPAKNAFTAAYDGADADAAALHVGLSGLLPVHDARFAGTVELVERELRQGPVVYRYLSDDGLPGGEGGFTLCAGWLVDSFVRIGRRADAEALFECMLKTVGPTGLMAEEFDPRLKIGLGNIPQAYSHVALIENALQLSQEP